MNFNFYIFGTPSGYNQYPADNGTMFQEFAQNNTTESQLTVFRKRRLVYYSYLRRLREKSSNYLGFCLIFNDVYCHNSQKLFTIFNKAFDEVVMKGKLLHFDTSKLTFAVRKFTEESLEIERIKTFFEYELKNNFNHDFVDIPASFKVGNGKTTISIKETNSDILAAIAQFDCVHISNDEKSLSELERTHKMLTELYTEKQNLDKKYRKLVLQKKQYKVVLFLCLTVIGCAVGLFVFNKNLQSKDNQIGRLNNTINRQQSVITNRNSKIVQLQTEKDSLNKTISNLREDIDQKETVIKEQNNQIANLNGQIREGKNTIQESEITIRERDRQIVNLNWQIEQKEKENSNLRNSNTNLSADLRKKEKENENLSKQISDKESEIKKLKQPFKVQVYLDKNVYNSSYERINVYGPIVITIDPKSNTIYQSSGIKSADIYSTELKYYKN